MPFINHVALWVKDLEKMTTFYTTFLAAIPGPRYHNPDIGFTSRFLTCGTGPRLELMHMDGLAEPLASRSFGYAHMAFSLGSSEAVDSLTHRLQSEGLRVINGPRRTGDGYYESEVLDPEGNSIELTV